MYIGKPISKSELDLLLGLERAMLVFKDLDGQVIDVFKNPSEGWTHTLIERVYACLCWDKYKGGFDIYLGFTWVGGTEV